MSKREDQSLNALCLLRELPSFLLQERGLAFFRARRFLKRDPPPKGTLEESVYLSLSCQEPSAVLVVLSFQSQIKEALKGRASNERDKDLLRGRDLLDSKKEQEQWFKFRQSLETLRELGQRHSIECKGGLVPSRSQSRPVEERLARPRSSFSSRGKVLWRPFAQEACLRERLEMPTRLPNQGARLFPPTG